MLGANQFGGAYLGQSYAVIDLSRGHAAASATSRTASVRRQTHRHIGATTVSATARAPVSATSSTQSATADADNAKANVGAS